MRSTLEQLGTTLDDLDAFVKSIDPVNTLLESQKDGAILRYLRVRKRLDYAAFIVGLYAAFEKFVEDLVWSLAEVSTSLAGYVELPGRLRDKHLRESAELLARGRLGEGRYAGFTAVDVVSNLHSCLSGTMPYRLNRPAVVQHETNLRAQTVLDVFRAVGVEDVHDGARITQPLLTWYANVNELEPRPGDVPFTSIELRLTDLVDRRNQVAHNGGDVTEVLGVMAMNDLLLFIRAYGLALFEVVAGVYLDRRYVKMSDGAPSLGEPLEGPFKDGHVVVVGKPACDLAKGQSLFGVTGGRVDRWGLIEELQVDDTPVERVDVTSSAVSVGLRVDFKVSKNTKLHVLPAKDELVWG